MASFRLQVEGCKLRDYGGDYELFLSKNASEASVMADKAAKQRELEKKQIKAKSKARPFRPQSFECGLGLHRCMCSALAVD